MKPEACVLGRGELQRSHDPPACRGPRRGHGALQPAQDLLTPHGSYGPGAGAVAVRSSSWASPRADRHLRRSRLSPRLRGRRTIGKVGTFFGMVLNVVKAYGYVLAMGTDGFRAASEWSVINNNYLIRKLLEVPGMDISFSSRKLQEARFTLQKLLEDTGVSTTDFNYGLADFGSPPTSRVTSGGSSMSRLPPSRPKAVQGGPGPLHRCLPPDLRGGLQHARCREDRTAPLHRQA